jgi:protein-tyrosine kinase
VNLIEQAARRLEELRRSGVEAPTTIQVRPGAATVARGGRPDRGRSPSISGPVGGPETAAKLVEIDLQRLSAMGYLTPAGPRTQIENEFRVIKRPLLKNVFDRPDAPVERANLIMVTSSLPGEGKTFVAINLAISMAMELDTTVLLVDADVSRPSILQRLGLEPAPGLLDLLSDTSRGLSDVLLRTNIQHLSILPAGTPDARATEMLASVQMTRLLDDVSSRYSDRIIVFDAPPLLPSPESRVLASHMGQIVVLVEAECTSYQTVAATMATLEGCPVVLPLLNKTNRTQVGTYYGYYAAEEKPT